MTMVLSGSGTITGLNPGGLPSAAITYASIQAVSAGKVLGKDTSGSGTVQELPIAVDSSGNVTIGGGVNFGGSTFAKSSAAITLGNISFDNGSADTPGLHFYYAANSNFGIDSAASGLRFVKNLDESGGVLFANIDSSANLQFNSGYGSVATAYGCRAWVNWNGSGGASIRASGNVSSVTRNTTGDYTVNFTSAMPDINYSVATSITFPQYGFYTATNNGSDTGTAAYTTGSIRVVSSRYGGGSVDGIVCTASVFR
jgi:hypothetical protein